MDNFNWLLQGFAEAATPMNLLYAVIGVLLGTAVGVLPGIGPAMTVALLLPITYNVSPSAAFIMFAGIFYGGMYGGSTTSILLNTPGESSSVITAIEGNKMAKAGRAAQALATAAIGSFVAGAIGTAAAGGVRPGDVAVRGDPRRAVLPGDHAVRAGRGHRGAGLRRSCAALISLLLGLAIGAGRHRLADRAAARHVRAAAAVRRHRHRGDRGGDLRRSARRCGWPRICAGARPRSSRSAGRGWARATGSGRGSRGCAAPRSGSRSARCPPAAPNCRRSCPTSPRRSCPSTPRSSARAPSRASPARRRPTTPRPQARWCRCCRWACPPTPPRR